MVDKSDKHAGLGNDIKIVFCWNEYSDQVNTIGFQAIKYSNLLLDICHRKRPRWTNVSLERPLLSFPRNFWVNWQAFALAGTFQMQKTEKSNYNKTATLKCAIFTDHLKY